MLQDSHQHQLALQYAKQAILTSSTFGVHSAHWPAFEVRLDHHFPTLLGELAGLYGEREDFLQFLSLLCQEAWMGWVQRPADLRNLDAQREQAPDWFQSQTMLGGVCYADLYAGGLRGLQTMIPYFKELGLTYLHIMPPFKCPTENSDGGYAVSSYREVNPVLGSMQDLKNLAAALRKEGISLVLDFIFNHTSDEHDWATAAMQGDAHYKDFYYIYPDRQIPDAYDRTLREIFPDQHPGGFSQLPDGRWIWTTFNTFQWDLNYANPAVFTAMAGEMLAIANVGAEFLRMDAVAFIWKQLGTTCENLPQAHALIRAFNAVCRIAAPSLLFKSEAIVHPDDVVKYIAPNECQISYNPLQMALLWNTLATREVNLLQQALEERHHIPDGTAWVNYVRSHDDIGWTFADEDAVQFGINGFDHRQFLNRFYVNRFEGSFARGVPFQDNPVTNDCRISGTCASLAGLEQHDPHAVARILLLHSVALSSGGIPLIYLGDEVGTLNDPDYVTDAGKVTDSRWVHRPARDSQRYAQRQDASAESGRIYQGLRNMFNVRQQTQAFAGGRLTGFRTGNASVLGYQRNHANGDVLVLCNFSEFTQHCEAAVFSALPHAMRDLLTGTTMDTRQRVLLAPYAVHWLVAA